MASGKSSLYKTNWNKYEEAITDVVRKEVCRVFEWLYQGGNKYVGDYLAEIPGGRKGLMKKEKETLEKKQPPTDMDITLLYYLLLHTCGLAEANDPVWTDNNSSLEHTLYLIKEERNKLSHEGHTLEAQKMSDAELEQNLNNLRDLCNTLLTEAAKKCDRLGETNKLIDKMEARLREIQGVTVERFVLKAREEMLKVPPPRMSADWYQEPLLILQNGRVGLDDLLQSKAAGGAGTSFLLVSGEAGIGKSSLCRYLKESWLRPRSDGKGPVQHYQLVLRLHCRDIFTCDAVRLVREKLLPEAASQCCNDTLLEVFSTVPILWLLDGLDEATGEAQNLLSSFLCNPRQKSTVVLTSRPEFGQDFLRQHSNKGIQWVSLLGANPLEVIKCIILSTKRDEDTVRHAKSLMEEFMRLDHHVQMELRNPLKLRLALQDWEALRTSTLRREFELGRLYQKITNKQIESLSQKVTEGPIMTMSEATRKVRKWFSFLCESTFHLVQSRTPITDDAREEFLTKLEDKCDELRISSSKCLSTFLANQDSVFSTGHSRYTFHHDSQVHFLAALHIACVMKESKDLQTDIMTLFEIDALQEYPSEVPPLQHFLHVLQVLISLIDDTTPDNNISMMIKLFRNAMPFFTDVRMCFEIAKKASFVPKVMKEIAKLMPEIWYIFDSSIEAARRMLEYQQPTNVQLMVIDKPEDMEELKPLLSVLAKHPIRIHLTLYNHIGDYSGNNTSDPYLEIICRKESRCVLGMFQGCLGERGYDLLKHPNITNRCSSIALKVKSVKSLETLATRVQTFKSLKTMIVAIAMKELPHTSARLPNIDISLVLPFATKETSESVANFVAGLSQSFNTIFVNYIAKDGNETLSFHLKQKGVTTKSLVIGGEKQLRILGSLPFEDMWTMKGVDKAFQFLFTPEIIAGFVTTALRDNLHLAHQEQS